MASTLGRYFRLWAWLPREACLPLGGRGLCLMGVASPPSPRGGRGSAVPSQVGAWPPQSPAPLVPVPRGSTLNARRQRRRSSLRRGRRRRRREEEEEEEEAENRGGGAGRGPWRGRRRHRRALRLLVIKSGF